VPPRAQLELDAPSELELDAPSELELDDPSELEPDEPFELDDSDELDDPDALTSVPCDDVPGRPLDVGSSISSHMHRCSCPQ
jgi:hypothetical protein